VARSRLDLDAILRTLITDPETETMTGKVYFQPPNNLSMVYPAIVYERETSRSQFADNLPFANTKRYTVTVITEDVDSDIPDKVAALPMSTHNRFFISGQLNHDVFNVYF